MNDQTLDNLLDGTLDDIADLPEFKVFPPGAHIALVTFKVKEVNKHPCIEVSCKIVSTNELAEPTRDTAPEPGSVANMLCMLDNEFGAGAFKALAAPIGEMLGTKNLRDIVEQTTDLECLLVTAYRANKDDKDKPYMNIKELYLV